MQQINDEKVSKGMMEFIPARVGRYQKFILKGKLIYTSIQWAKKRFNESIEDADGYIVDMHHIEQIDSTGFGYLINIGKKVKKDNKNMVVLVKDEMIRELFAISKLDQVFSIVKEEEEGMNVLDRNTSVSTIKLEEY